MEIQQYREVYSSQLKEDILPFWLKYGLDRVHGGIYTCVDRDGTLMDGTKSVWFQGRGAFSFAYAYNNIEKRQEWLDASKHIIAFLEAHCFDKDGRMFFEVMADGTPLRKRRYIFSESFAAIAFAEYAKASGDREYAEKAVRLFKKMQEWLSTPGVLEPKYLPVMDCIGHSPTMIMLGVAGVISDVSDDPALAEQVRTSFDLIKNKLYKPEYRTLLEVVNRDGTMIDSCMGRTINPGHCIETAWFLMEAATLFPQLPIAEEMREFGLTVLNDALAWGWDEEFGGIINFKDAKGFSHQDYSQDMKFWWPQTEAIIALLYAYKLTGDRKYLDWHKKVHDWTYAHFPDKEYGEWYGYLHRDGTVAQPAKGNIFKGPFHIPRMLVKASLLCGEISKQ